MNIIIREFGIFITTFIFCYLAHKFDTYNVVILYMLVRVWFELVLDKGEDKE